jgi:hypothetical protein
VHAGSVKIIDINGTYKVSDSVCFLSENQIIHLPSVVVDQVVIERTMYLLFSDELDSDHYDALLPIEEKVRFVYINILC